MCNRFHYDSMGRLKQISDATQEEIDTYLSHLDWTDNPFTKDTTVDDYVLPEEGDVADVISHINQYTGPVLVHSRYTGVGKTTMIKTLLTEFEDDYTTVYVGEHNVTPYELIGIVADRLGVGKSSSTKLTEDKLIDASFDEPILIAIDEFGLNDPDTLHTIQFINDELDTRVVLTGMTSQWNAVEGIGSEGKAFQRRVSFELELEPFDFEKTEELVKRRITRVTDTPYDEWETASYESFITEEALRYVHEQSKGVAGVLTSSLADAMSLVSFTHLNGGQSVVDEELAEKLSYSDPVADLE
jgi:type II secretory pathway predicted ATPase ExeA